MKLEMLESQDTGGDSMMLDQTKEQQIKFMITAFDVVKESNRVFCDPYSRVISNYLAQNDNGLEPSDFVKAISGTN